MICCYYSLFFTAVKFLNSEELRKYSGEDVIIIWGSFWIINSLEYCLYPDMSFAMFCNFNKLSVCPTSVLFPGVHNDPVS